MRRRRRRARAVGWAGCLLALVLGAPRGAAYVESPLSLGAIVAQSTNIVLLELEDVDREGNVLRFRKVKDLKGRHPSDRVTQHIGQSGFHPREWQTIMQWAKAGLKAVFFHNGGASETCIDTYWYQCYGEGREWRMTHAEPYLLRSYAGEAAKLAEVVETVLRGDEAVAPCMVDGDKNALALRSARLQRLRVSLSRQDYDPERDFAGWGAGELRMLAGMAGFTHLAPLPRVDPETAGVAVCDYDQDGRSDLCLFGPARVAILHNEGTSFPEVFEGEVGGREEKGAAGLAGARRAAWADGTGDGLPDLLLATAAGPRLLVGTGSEPPFRDASEGLPRLPAWNLLDAAWIDADFDGRLDILLANGFHGVRLFRNLGVDAGAAPPACRFADLGSLEWEEAPGEEGAAPGGGGGAGLEGGGGGARKARGDFRVRGLLVAQLDGDSLDDVLLLGERPLLLTRAPGGGFRAASRPPSLAGASRPAAGDFDRDGDLDVFVPEGAFGRLLENAGDARFHEVTTRAIGPVLGATGRASGAAWGDLDGDGRLDLLVTATGGPNRILLGGEGARLSDASRDLGLDLEVFHTGGGALSDLDGDGDLDLALANDGGPSAVLFSALGGAVRRPGAPASSPPLSSPPLSSPPLSPEEGGAAPPAADAPSPARAEWEWPTYRGDLRRSGTAGSSPGPRVPAVLWSLPGKSHYLAAPAPGRGSIYLPALGPFNSALALAVDVDPAAERRVRWQKSPPAITLPPACSPVVAEGVVLFGEGMHQNAAGALAAFSAADGLPLWRLEVEGELRHVEGSPAVEGGRIYFGCGSGGVLCADLRRIRMEGRELAPEAAAARVWERWQEFLAAYEKEKASDPDFAVEPDESALPSGTVEVLWTAGADAWHVDTPVAVIGERVIAASSYLDEEKKGTRALFALAAADGRIEWQVRLRWNPWGAPSALRREEDGEALILVGSSSVRYDPARLRGARGEVVAVELESGRLRWRREVPGGVLSPVSIAPSGELGVFTATDGMVRALRTETGEIAWSHRSDSPYFAGVALASARVYAADLDGAVRALDLQSGAEVWRLDLASHPRVGLPGRVYAPPLCAGERLYVATANVEGPHAGKPTAIVAIGEEAPREASRGVTLEREKRRVVIDARMAPRKLPHLEGIYPIEVLAAQPHGAKAHETVVTIDAMPSAIHEALEALGLHAGTPGLGEEPGRGPEVRIAIEFEGPGGVARRVEAGDSVLDRRTGLPLGKGLVWRFTGSSPVRLDPTQETESYGADSSGTFACVYPVSRETVIQSSLGMDDESVLELEVAPWMPPVGTAVRLIVLVETGKEAR